MRIGGIPLRAGRRKGGRIEVSDWKWPDLVLLLLLLLVSALPWGGFFVGTIGYRAALGGVLLGFTGALLLALRRAGAIASITSLVLLHLLLGGIIALPDTLRFAALPTPQTLRLLLTGPVTGWKDLLTVESPVMPDGALAVVPLVAGEAAAALSLLLSLRVRNRLRALAPVALLGLTGILWGSQNAPLDVVIGLAWSALALAWATVTNRRMRAGAGSADLKIGEGRRRVDALGVLGLVSLLAVSGSGALASVALLPQDGHRTVLRDFFDPPLDLRDYTSPASSYRPWTTKDADTVLLHVSNLPAGSRIRLATLDSYDGTVFRISDAGEENTFVRVGPSFTDEPDAPGENPVDLRIDVEDYRGPWVPTGRRTRSLRFTSERADALSAGLHTSRANGAVLSTTPLEKGDSYLTRTVVDQEIPDAVLEERAVVAMPMPVDSNVPEIVSSTARRMTEGAAAGFEQARTLQRRLSSEGFYSDGSDGMSRSGHRADRLAAFLEADHLVGDDDQYAPAMALMLRSLGIPSRVVIGFAPSADRGSEVSLKGEDARMWVEVPFEGIGWAPFDPTPPKDQKLRSQVPEPKPRPRPEVLQPPEPPEDPAELPNEEFDESDKDKDSLQDRDDSILKAVLLGAGGVGLLLSPLLLLAALRMLRSKRRRSHGSAEVRALAAWDELLDRSAQLGVAIPRDVARQVQAGVVDERLLAHEGSAADPGGEAGIASKDAKGLAPAPAPGGTRTPRPDPGPVPIRFRQDRESTSEALALAEDLDALVFGPEAVAEERAHRVWTRMDGLLDRVNRSVGRRRRFRALFSLGGIRSAWTRPEPEEPKTGGAGDPAPWGSVEGGGGPGADASPSTENESEYHNETDEGASRG